ncbi:hypothetical protein [Lentilactobacillus parabuchneri]
MKKVVFLENAKGNRSYVKNFNTKSGYMAFTPNIEEAQRCDDQTVKYYEQLGGTEFNFHELEAQHDTRTD